jgi:LCP family protein required for cell wall assembly
MRTTLKRGIGRGAEVNGNGRAVLPPGVLTPMKVYRQPPPAPPSTLRLIGKFFLWLLLGLVMLACAAAGGLYLWAHESIGATAPHTLAVKRAAKRLDYVAPGRPAIALVIGSDHRYTDHGLPARSDTIMLIRTDPETKALSMLSLPRDLAVEIHCPGRGTWVGKINSAYSECGPTGTLETVKALTGVPVNYLISVNFRGFKQIVDRLGGVWIDVDHRYYNRNVGTIATNYANIDLQPGYQRLGGENTLAFVRYRHTDSDLYRVARQQLFVKAVKDRLSRISAAKLPFAVPRLVGAVVHNTEIGRAGGKGVDLSTVKNYAFFLYNLPAGHFFQPRIEGLTGLTDLHTGQANIDAAVQDFLNPDVEAPAKATEVALGIKLRPRPKRVPPASVYITVLNGNGAPGSARDGSYLLTLRGYHVLAPPNGLPANAPTFDYFHTKVYFDPRQGRSRPAAVQVAKLFGTADVAGPIPPALQPLANGAKLVVVLGQTFKGTLAPVTPERTQIKREPAFVRRDSATALSLLRYVRHRVSFRLELPTVLERNSTLASQSPIRTYQVSKDHLAVRLTFYRGSPGDYWGIQETDWTDAPVLSGRNFRHRIGGRIFDLYYTGQHLHMVVLREDHATYWVVNTLVDSLSNETMLAIAKGLKPLRR